VDASALERIESRIRGINGTAKILRTTNADAPIEKVLNVGAFDLQRALAVDETFLEPEYPFEWGGVYQLAEGDHLLRAGGAHDDHAHEHGAHEHGEHCQHDHDHEHAHGDGAHAGHAHEDLELVVLSVPSATPEALQAATESAVRGFAEPATVVNCHGEIAAGPGSGPGHYAIDISHAGADFALHVARAGAYALFCEHHPLEFGLHLAGQRPAAERKFASHHHQDDISSIGISDPRPLDPAKLNQWLDYLLKTRGQDIFRMKGVLNVKGEDRRQVFHGVHMMFDAQPERPWGDAPRVNNLVFIGRNLERAEFEAGFESAVAK
jgi:G3E family GTPase